MKLERLAHIAAALCLAAIIYVSMVPGTMRPHTGASGHMEHFMAYAGTNFLLIQGMSWNKRLAGTFLLCVLSGIVEIVQIWIPGRTGEFAGFAFSSLGAIMGLVAGSLAWSLWLYRFAKKRA